MAETIFDVLYLSFAIMGILIIVLFAREAKKADDRVFGWMWLAIALSFAFYLLVVLFAEQIPLLGMLMLPRRSRMSGSS